MPDPALIAHAAVCPSCRRLADRFELLEDALQNGITAPVVDPWVSAQIVAGLEPVASPGTRHRTDRRSWMPWAASLAAACLLLAPSWTLQTAGPVAPKPAIPVGRAAAPEPLQPLASTLAEATASGLELARETSEPAARLGRVLLISTRVPRPAETVPSTESGDEPDLWKSVGDRVVTGVRPLSAPARQAFGFLVPTEALAQGPPPRDRGA